MSTQESIQLAMRPSHLHFGTNYAGATIQGYLQIPHATSCLQYSWRGWGEGQFGSDDTLPNWVQLENPIFAPEHGLLWKYTIRTDNPGLKYATLGFRCDIGTAKCQTSIIIRDESPPRGELIFCSSPFDFHTVHYRARSLVQVLDAIPFRVHSLTSLAELDRIDPATLVLSGTGLLSMTEQDIEMVRCRVSAGGNLIVFADEFYRGTTAVANRLVAPYGLQFKQDFLGATGAPIVDWERQALDWLSAGPAHVGEHRLTHDVKRTHWFRPCPISCIGNKSHPLIKNPANAAECFAAVSQEAGYVIAVGKSHWSSLCCVGWPYDNDRLLANCLVGGDAESMLR